MQDKKFLRIEKENIIINIVYQVLNIDLTSLNDSVIFHILQKIIKSKY